MVGIAFRSNEAAWNALTNSSSSFSPSAPPSPDAVGSSHDHGSSHVHPGGTSTSGPKDASPAGGAPKPNDVPPVLGAPKGFVGAAEPKAVEEPNAEPDPKAPPDGAGGALVVGLAKGDAPLLEPNADPEAAGAVGVAAALLGAVGVVVAPNPPNADAAGLPNPPNPPVAGVDV